MKIKKFPQSHLLLQNGDSTIIIDPGYLTYQNGFKVKDFQGADAYLITHQHGDHLDPDTISEVVGDRPVYGNSDVVSKLKEVGVANAISVSNREKFKIAGFEIEAIDLPHFSKEGTVMPPNTGFLINGIFFHPGDGDKAPQNLTSDNLALTIGGASITLESSLEFAKSVKAKLVVPIHYDVYKTDPNEFKELAEKDGIKVIVLSFGEETEAV